MARITNLYEVASVTNNADSLNAQMAITSSDNTVVAKPQVISNTVKSIKDLQKYTTVDGDTISGLAVKFNITSDSIRWSNTLSGNTLKAGQVLWIPPVPGIVYTVKSGDSADSLANKYHANKDQIIAFNDAEVSGLVAGKQIVIPDGNIQAAQAVTSFAFGLSAQYGFNGYDFGWCTWYAANRRAELGRPVPSNLGNAYSWYILARNYGLPTGLVPAVGAVAVNQGGNHVSIVEIVNLDGSFIVSEMNSSGWDSIANIGVNGHQAGGWGRIDYKLYTSVGNLKFIY